MAPAKQGVFISFEGGEGAGKSTQASRLADALRRIEKSVVETREPGGTDGAEQIRRLLVSGPADRWDGTTETLLHVAARRDHVEKVIKPALASGDWVLCDRFTDSTVAYQGAGRGVQQPFIDRLHDMILGDLRPDLTIILDVAVKQGLSRAEVRDNGTTDGEDGEGRYERMDLDFHRRVAECFRDIAEQQSGRCVSISANRSIDDVQADIKALIAKRFGVEWP